ncbi:INO80 complex subunit D-like isoform X2 [Corticium candelabrum]|uniref:INO80 complex subunit D-like isoform X2 n=1 Tax=Corticium candelabrum TaxID=121492 RepID=UPI002E26B7BA|nr:INO80 complex subunit D-like isoform X2 [Corticium candelabrum]
MKSFTFPSLSMCQNCHGRNIRPGRRARRERRETAMAGGQTQSDLLGHDSLIDDPLMVDGLIDHADHPGNITSDHSTKGMYEGKNVHYSAVDGKPLCSYSGKLCKQRRLNGYAFCIRHVLEDPGARFKQCQYVARYNNQRCTNPIPDNEDRIYCNSHMQVLGLVPKTVRKKKVATMEPLSPIPSTTIPSPSSLPQMPPPSKAAKARTPRKTTKGQTKVAQGKRGQGEGKRKTTKPRTRSPLIANHELPERQHVKSVRDEERAAHARASGKASSRRVGVVNVMQPNVMNVSVASAQVDIKNLSKLKPVLDLWSTLRLFKWQAKQLIESDVYPCDSEHVDCLVAMEVDSIGDIKRDDDITACQHYDSLVAQRKAECEDGMKHLELTLRDARDVDSRLCVIVRKTVRAARDAPIPAVASCLLSSNRDLRRLKTKRRICRSKLCCTATVGMAQCRRKVLPFTRHCLQHICRNEAQFLFRSCAGFITGDHGVQHPCPFPVTDITQTYPYCSHHTPGSVQPQPTPTPTSPSHTPEPPAKQAKRKAPMASTQVKRVAKPRATKPHGTSTSSANNHIKQATKSATGGKPKVVRAKQAHVPVLTSAVDHHINNPIDTTTRHQFDVKPPRLVTTTDEEKTTTKQMQTSSVVKSSRVVSRDGAPQRGSKISTTAIYKPPQTSHILNDVKMPSHKVSMSSSDSSSDSDSASSGSSSSSDDDGLVMATNEGMPQYEHDRLQNALQIEQTPGASPHQRRQSGSKSPFLGTVTTPTHQSQSPQFQRHFNRQFSSELYNDLSPGYQPHRRASASQHEFAHDVNNTVRALYPTQLPFDDIQPQHVDQSGFEFDLISDMSPYKQSTSGSPFFAQHVTYPPQHHSNSRGMTRDMNMNSTGSDSFASGLFHGSSLFDASSPMH